MAKVIEQNVVISLSKLVKDSAGDKLDLLDESATEQLEAVLAELIGDDTVVVEVVKG